MRECGYLKMAFLVCCNVLASVSPATVCCYRAGYVSFSVLLLRYFNDNRVFVMVVIHHDVHSSSKASDEGCCLLGPVEVTAKFDQVSKVQLGQK